MSKHQQSGKQKDEARPYRIIGTPRPKVDAYGKVTGRALYADDIMLPRMLYGRLLRSPHPHARIVSIDTRHAMELPGVLAVITGEDLPQRFGILPSSQDEYALAIDKVRYVGDPVAAVAAIDPDILDEAIKLIHVEYEILPALMTIDEAMEHPEVKINDEARIGNIHKAVSYEFGDMERGFAGADYVREDWFFYEGNNHAPMEEHACVANWEPNPNDPVGGKITLWSSTQTPHYVHRELSKVMGLPQSHVRVIAPHVGGGFGGKSDPFSHEICAAELSRRTGRPIKITCNREEVFLIHRGRHPVKMWIKTGVKKDGTLTAMHFRSFLDGGAYGSYGIATTYYTGALQTVTYTLPCYKFEGMRLITNKPPCGPKRGHGTTQPRYAVELPLDKIAHELRVQPGHFHLETADTTLTPVDLGSYSSRVTFMAGNAVIAAARKLKAQLFEVASVQLRVPEERLRAENGVIYDEDDPGTSLSFIQAVQLAEARYGALVASGSYAPPEGIHGDYKGAGVGPSPAYSYSACVAQVAVDVETGEVVVEKLWLAHDVGQSINPLLVAGQVEGGAYMGYGEAVMEQQIFRKGRHKIPSLLDYKLPTTLDTPEIETILIEIPDREGPFGGKEAGQGPLNPVIPAIANAVFDAVGVRIDETPITSDKVLKALRAESPGARSVQRPQVEPVEVPSPWPTRLITWQPTDVSLIAKDGV